MQNNQPVEQSTPAPESVETPSAELSLADYRASREATVAAPAVKETAATTVPSGEELDETAATSDDAEQDTQEQPAVDAGEKGKPRKGGFQKKIEKLEAEKQDLERRLAEKEPAAKPADQAAPASSEQPPAYEKPKPKLEDFDGIEDFTEALTDWKAEEREFKANWTIERVAAAARTEQALGKWSEQVAEAKTRYADYDEVLSAVDAVGLSPAHQRILVESEHGAELAYQLAKDPETLERIAALSPLAAAREIGKLEAALPAAAAAAPEPRNTVSKAPKPFRSLSGAAAPAKAAASVSSRSRAFLNTNRAGDTCARALQNRNPFSGKHSFNRSAHHQRSVDDSRERADLHQAGRPAVLDPVH